MIGAVDSGSPAERAGLVPGDEIVSIDGKPIPSWEDATYQIVLRPEQELKLRLRREGAERELSVRSETQTVQKIGSIGVHPLVRIGQVLPGTPAEAAGFRPEDAILSIDGKPIKEFTDVLPAVSSSAGRSLTFRLWRSGQLIDVPVTPRDSGQGFKVGLGPWFIVKKFGPVEAVREALAWTWKQVTLTFDVIGRLLTARLSPKTMMGPLGIAQASGDAARSGTGSLLFLVAVISLQVGILNLFPLAPLDGGHLAIIAVEGVARRDLSPTVKNWIMNAGAAMIFLLIGLVLYSDISKMSFVQRLFQ